MRNTCAQPVDYMGVASKITSALPTSPSLSRQVTWIKWQFYPSSLHTFLTQLYAGHEQQITDEKEWLSPLSTPLIIRATPKNKENSLLITGGKV